MQVVKIETSLKSGLELRPGTQAWDSDSFEIIADVCLVRASLDDKESYSSGNSSDGCTSREARFEPIVLRCCSTLAELKVFP